ncbi:MAG: hypothetical protein AAB389_04470 [Patescibacteria group bacterium]
MYDILPEIGIVLGCILTVCGMFFFTNVGLKKSSQMAAPAIGSKEWTKRWEAVARKADGQAIPSEIPPEVQLEAAVTVDDLNAKRNTHRTRRFFKDMKEAMAENTTLTVAEKEISRRIRRETNRHKFGMGQTVKIRSCRHGKRVAIMVGVDQRGRGIFQPIGRKCRIRRHFELVEAA